MSQRRHAGVDTAGYGARRERRPHSLRRSPCRPPDQRSRATTRTQRRSYRDGARTKKEPRRVRGTETRCGAPQPSARLGDLRYPRATSWMGQDRVGSWYRSRAGMDALDRHAKGGDGRLPRLDGGWWDWMLWRVLAGDGCHETRGYAEGGCFNSRVAWGNPLGYRSGRRGGSGSGGGPRKGMASVVEESGGRGARVRAATDVGASVEPDLRLGRSRRRRRCRTTRSSGRGCARPLNAITLGGRPCR